MILQKAFKHNNLVPVLLLAQLKMAVLLNEVWKQQYSVLFSAAEVLSTFAFLTSRMALARQA